MVGLVCIERLEPGVLYGIVGTVPTYDKVVTALVDDKVVTVLVDAVLTYGKVVTVLVDAVLTYGKVVTVLVDTVESSSRFPSGLGDLNIQRPSCLETL
jgi:hypothetical protein